MWWMARESVNDPEATVENIWWSGHTEKDQSQHWDGWERIKVDTMYVWQQKQCHWTRPPWATPAQYCHSQCLPLPCPPMSPVLLLLHCICSPTICIVYSTIFASIFQKSPLSIVNSKHTHFIFAKQFSTSSCAWWWWRGGVNSYHSLQYIQYFDVFLCFSHSPPTTVLLTPGGEFPVNEEAVLGFVSEKRVKYFSLKHRKNICVRHFQHMSMTDILRRFQSNV